MARVFVILVFYIYPSIALSHQDRIIVLDENRLIGIPSEFQPALLDLGNLKLTLSGKSVVFPDCINSVLKISNSKNIQILSSWYHQRDLLPAYILFRNKELKSALVVNLVTLEPIELYSFSDSENKFKNCLDEYKGAIK